MTDLGEHRSESGDETLPRTIRSNDGLGSYALLCKRYFWLILIVAAHLPLMIVHFGNLWIRPQYQHFPLILLSLWCLVVMRVNPIGATSEEATKGTSKKFVRLGVWVLGLAFCIFILATYFFSPWLAAVSLWLTVGGTMIALCRDFKIEMGWGIWLIFALLIPVPGNYEMQVSQYLQSSTTNTSGYLLSAMKIPNIVQGTTLTLASGRLFVEEACSGIVSLMSVLATCLVLAVMFRRPMIHAALLVFSGVLWASVMNIVRIVLIALGRERYHVDLAEGWEHTLLGLIVYVGSLLLILSTDQLLSFFIDPGTIDDEGFSLSDFPSVILWRRIMGFGGAPSEEVASQPDWSQFAGTDANVSANTWQKAPLIVSLSMAFCMLGIVGVSRAVSRAFAGEAVMRDWDSQLVQSLNLESMPSEINSWIRADFRVSHSERLFAQESRIWEYQRDDARAVFSVDFTFPHWHDLCQCYQSIGWKQNGPSEYASLNESPFVEAQFFQHLADNGHLYFCLCDTQGNYVRPLESLPPIEQLAARTAPDQSLLQIQLWVTRERSASPEEAELDKELFLRLRDELRALIIAEGNTPSATPVLMRFPNRWEASQ